MEADRDKLVDVVKTQNLTAEEVLQMNTEHETLSRNLEDLKLKISETHKVVLTLEVNVTNRAAAAEEALDAYTQLLTSLNLYPPLPEPFQDVDLMLELNTAASNPAHLLIGSDIKKVIKPTLTGLAEGNRSDRAVVETDRIRVDNELDQLTHECENVDEEIRELDRQIELLNQQAEDLRDVSERFLLLHGY